MQKNNLIDLKKAQILKKNDKVDESEHLSKLELLRQESRKRTGKAAVSAEENAAAAGEEGEMSEEKYVSGAEYSADRPSAFWFKLGKSFLYCLIFLLPLSFLPTTVYPVDANKQLLATVLVSASFICYLANAYFTRKIIYSRSILVIAAAFFIFAGAISAFFSVSPDKSIFGDFTQADILSGFVIYGLALYLTAVYFKKEDFNKIGIVFLSSIILVSILGLLQLLGFYIFPYDFAKQSGFNVFGSVINFDLFIAFGLVLIVAALTELDIALRAKAGLISAGLLIAVNLVLINYQPIWISLAIVMVVYAIYKFTFKAEDSATYSAGSSTPLIIGIAAFLFALVSPSLSNIIALPNLPVDVKPNFSATMNISKEALSGFRVLTGTGLATFSSQYNAYRPVELNQSNFWRIKFNQGFSFVSTYFTTSGIIGLLSILFIIFAFARLAIRNIENKKAMIVSIGVFFMLLSWFFYPAYFVGLLFSFMSLGIIVAFDSRHQELAFSHVSKIHAAASFTLIIILAAGAISMLYISGKKYVAAFYFQSGLKEYNLANIIKSVENMSEAVSLDRSNDQYLRSASLLLLMDAEKSRDTSLETGQDMKFIDKMDNSIKLAKSATEINPADFENWYNLGNIYEKIINIADGADSSAATNYQKAAELNPKNPDLLISQAKVLMYTAQVAKDDNIKIEKIQSAINILKKSIELKSDYAVSHFQLALAYMQANRNEEAIKEFEITKILSDPDTSVNFQLGMLYYNMNDFEKAKYEMENAVNSDSNFSNARYVLGLIYDKKGEKDNAIIQFESVLKLNPKNAEVEKILNNLKISGSVFVKDKSESGEIGKESLDLSEAGKGEMINIDADNDIIEEP